MPSAKLQDSSFKVSTGAAVPLDKLEKLLRPPLKPAPVSAKRPRAVSRFSLAADMEVASTSSVHATSMLPASRSTIPAGSDISCCSNGTGALPSCTEASDL